MIPYMKNQRYVANALKIGRIVIYPTDTIYGMGSLWSAESNSMIYDIKRRNKAKPLIMLSNLQWVKQFAYYDDRMKDIKKFWPGRYTLILKAKKPLPWWISDGKTVAIRVPANKVLQRLLMMVGEPITSTSVNISNNAPMNNPLLIAEQFENKVDLIAQYSDFIPKRASKIIDMRNNLNDDSIRCLRS